MIRNIPLIFVIVLISSSIYAKEKKTSCVDAAPNLYIGLKYVPCISKLSDGGNDKGYTLNLIGFGMTMEYFFNKYSSFNIDFLYAFRVVDGKAKFGNYIRWEHEFERKFIDIPFIFKIISKSNIYLGSGLSINFVTYTADKGWDINRVLFSFPLRLGHFIKINNIICGYELGTNIGLTQILERYDHKDFSICLGLFCLI